MNKNLKKVIAPVAAAAMVLAVPTGVYAEDGAQEKITFCLDWTPNTNQMFRTDFGKTVSFWQEHGTYPDKSTEALLFPEEDRIGRSDPDHFPEESYGRRRSEETVLCRLSAKSAPGYMDHYRL